jgi:hypothetical protein
VVISDVVMAERDPAVFHGGEHFFSQLCLSTFFIKRRKGVYNGLKGLAIASSSNQVQVQNY